MIEYKATRNMFGEMDVEARGFHMKPDELEKAIQQDFAGHEIGWIQRPKRTARAGTFLIQFFAYSKFVTAPKQPTSPQG